MHIFAVSPTYEENAVPGQLVFAMANGTTYMREHFPVEGPIVARALVQLQADCGIMVFAEDGQVWPFSYDMAQRIIDAFAPRHVHSADLPGLPLRDQAGLFEMALQRAFETEPSLSAIFAATKFAR